MQQVQIDDAPMDIRNKSEYYTYLKDEKEIFLPFPKSPIVTVHWLNLVRLKKVWVPLVSELKIRVLKRDVTRSNLIKAIERLCIAKSK